MTNLHVRLLTNRNCMDFLYLCKMKNKVRIQPMTGIQMMIEAKKMREKMEEREESINEAMALKMVLMNGQSPKKNK
jgi:hypothetical protein